MEVLAGVVIGVLVTVALLKRTFNIKIHHIHETVYPDLPEVDLAKEMRRAETPEDRVYSEDMTGLIEEVNKLMTGEHYEGR